MQVTETLSDGLRRSYAVRVPADEIDRRAKARLADIGKTLRMPGFRPGKVPANLVRQRFGTSVMAEVLQETVNGVAEQVVADHQLRPAGQPRVSLEGTPNLDAPTAQDLDLKVDLDLLPDIALPDLSALHLTRLRAEPSAEMVGKAMDNLATQRRSFEDAAEQRPAQTGETLLVDFTGRIDGTPFEGGTATDATVEVGGGGFIPGFTEQLEGLAPGETRLINVTFPDDYHATELAGKVAQFEIVAKSLKTSHIPPLDDAFGESLGFESLDTLREAVVAQLQQEYDQMSRLRIKRELLDLLAQDARFPSPQNLLEAEFAAIWQRVEQDRRAGRVDDEDRDKDEETLKAEYRAIADRRVRLGLLLAEIGRANSIAVTQPELNEAIRAELARYPGQEQQVLQFFQKNQGAIEQLRGPIFEDKVVDHILAQAQVTEKLVAAEALAMAEDDQGAPSLPAPDLDAPDGAAASEAPADQDGAREDHAAPDLAAPSDEATAPG